MILLATCLGGAWTLEQPRGSCLNFYPTFRYMLGRVFASGGPYAVSRTCTCSCALHTVSMRCEVVDGTLSRSHPQAPLDVREQPMHPGPRQGPPDRVEDG